MVSNTLENPTVSIKNRLIILPLFFIRFDFIYFKRKQKIKIKIKFFSMKINKKNTKITIFNKEWRDERQKRHNVYLVGQWSEPIAKSRIALEDSNLFLNFYFVVCAPAWFIFIWNCVTETTKFFIWNFGIINLKWNERKMIVFLVSSLFFPLKNH